MTRPTRAEIDDMRARLCSDDMDLVALCDAYLELESELEAGQFWREILREVPGGQHENIKKELMDFSFMMEQVPKVYSHITGGMLSKVMYYADVVIAQADEYAEAHTQEAIKDALEEALEPLEAENAALKSILHDYLARMCDTYDGAPDANNRMAFNGSDKDELERLLR